MNALSVIRKREPVGTVNSQFELTVGSSSRKWPTVRKTLTVATRLERHCRPKAPLLWQSCAQVEYLSP